MSPIPEPFYNVLKSLKPELAESILAWLMEANTASDVVVRMAIPLCAALPDETPIEAIEPDLPDDEELVRLGMVSRSSSAHLA